MTRCYFCDYPIRNGKCACDERYKEAPQTGASREETLRSSDVVGDCKRRMNEAEESWHRARRAVQDARNEESAAWKAVLIAGDQYKAAKSATKHICD